MIRDIDLVSYLPPFLREYKENVATLIAENPEFTLVWNAVDKILYNCFIETADAYGISRFEKLLNISPSSDDTLESRRARVKTRWVNLLPYTMKTLLQKLNILCGDSSYIISNNFKTGYTLTITTFLENYGEVEELNRLLQEIIPCNIVIDSQNQILCVARNQSHFAFRPAIHADVILTTDFSETWRADRTATHAGAVSFTNRNTITQDFHATYTANGKLKAASFGGYVDGIEIK